MQYFKRLESGGLFNFYELSNEGQTIVSFLADVPSIAVFLEADNPGINRSVQEVGQPISEAEFKEAYQRAMNHPDVQILT